MSSTEVKAVWMSGQLVPSYEANRQLSAEVMHSGVHETIRCYDTDQGPAVFRIDEHIDHFFHTARRLGMSIPFTPRELRAAVCQIVSANALTNCFVMPAAWFAGRIETAVVAWPWPFGSAPTSSPADETMFVVHNGVVSASGDPNLRAGVWRDTIFALARDRGLEVAGRDIDVLDVAAADEVFVVDSSAELKAVNVGPVTRAVKQAFEEATAGRNPQYRPWLHFVDDCMLAGAYNAASCF